MPPKCKTIMVLFIHLNDRAERHEFWPRLCLFFSPFLFPPKKIGIQKMRMNSKNHDQKTCLSAQSINFSNTAIAILIISLFLLVKLLLFIFFARISYFHYFPFYSYCSSNYSNCKWLLLFLSLKGDSNKFSFSLSHLRLIKSDSYCCCNSWKSNNYTWSNTEKKPWTNLQTQYKNCCKVRRAIPKWEQYRKVRYWYHNMGKLSITKKYFALIIFLLAVYRLHWL